MKKLILPIVVATSLFSASYEHYQLYKDPKIMSMGGANIAVGGQTTSLFYNTAGLSKIPKDYGWEVGIIDLSVSINENIMDFTDDLDKATSGGKTDSEETEATMEVLDKYMGKNNHLSVNAALLTVGKKFDEYAFGIVPFGGAIVNFKPHRSFSHTLETDGMVYGGAAFGISKDMKDIEIGNYLLNDLAIGVGVKTVSYKAWKHELSVAEIVEHDDKLGDYLQDTVAKDGSSAVLDLGAQYEVYPDVQVGLAMQNIGGVGDPDAVEVPMTVSAGVAYTKRLPENVFFNEFRVAFDYVDMFYGYEDEDFMKRTRLGIYGKVLDGWAGELGLSAGLYQGYYTAGVEARIFMVKVSAATYAEEVGAYSGQDEDRRFIVNLAVGF